MKADRFCLKRPADAFARMGNKEQTGTLLVKSFSTVAAFDVHLRERWRGEEASRRAEAQVELLPAAPAIKGLRRRINAQPLAPASCTCRKIALLQLTHLAVRAAARR